MKTKILITLRGGLIEAVHSNKEIEYVVIDHDLLDVGENFISAPREQDEIVENFFDLYTDATAPVDMEIRDELKRNHF